MLRGRKYIVAGTVFVLCFIFLGLVSPLADSSLPLTGMPIITVVGWMTLSGVSYLLLVKSEAMEGKLYLILALGALIRVAMLFSTPIITVDYFRYQWDGAVLANGINPYLYSPAQVIASDAPSVLINLASQSDSTLSRVIFPELRTPYPPVVQIFFALSHVLQPWSLTVWRLLMLAFDVLTLVLLLRLLDELDLPAWAVGVYWLNPVLVKEVINSGHMDVLILPFLLAGCLMHTRGKHYHAVTLLALSVGVKIWPIVLLPVFIHPIIPDIRKAASATVLFTALCVAFFYPVYISGVDGSLGMLAYAGRWEYNASIYKVILAFSEMMVSLVNSPSSAGFFARALTILLFLCWTLRVIRSSDDTADFMRRCALVIAGLLLLSPTFFPWYYVWIIPFLVFHPSPMKLFTALLPLYYLRFHCLAVGRVEIFDNYLVWLQFVPVWTLIAYEWLLNRSNSRGYGEEP